MQEFKHLDEQRKRTILKYKEEGEKQASKYRGMIEILKQQKKDIKRDFEETKRREEEQQNIIEQLTHQL